jgi:hypothetical protein
MPFSGGGGGQLTNHVHDNTPLQGGPLNFNNTTIGGMNSGDIAFSDGAALQQLAYPAVPAGETLTAVALSTAPAWTAAAAGVNNRVILDSQTFTNDTEDTVTFAAGGIDDSVYQKLQLVFTGDGLGNSIQRCMFRLDSNTPADYNENSIEVYNGSASYQNKNPQGGTDDWVRITDQLANSGKSWIATVDIMIPTAGETHTTVFYQVATYDRWASGSGYCENLSVAGQINRIQIELQGANNKDMQFTVYGIKF